VKNIQKFIEIEFIKKQTPEQLNDIFRTLHKKNTALESKLKESKEHHENEKQAHNVTWERARKLESKLKAAEEKQALSDEALEKSVARSQSFQADLIEANKKLALSVPFEVMCKNCRYKFCKGHRVLGSLTPRKLPADTEGETVVHRLETRG
jgi:cation transport regulator ChaB